MSELCRESRFNMDRLIYMDNAATTSVKPEVLNSMLPFFTDNYANPSSIYNFAQKSKKAVEDARTTIADIIGADKPNEIYFTAGQITGHLRRQQSVLRIRVII
jgi:cysteine desulfurase